MNSQDALATIENVSFGYQRRHQIVQGFSARFDPGVVYAISGPSGCGKSTVLSLAGLLLRPQSGDVSVLGLNCTRASDRQRSRIRRRHIGFVFQDALLETTMSVWENLSEALPVGTSTSRMRDKAAESLQALSLPYGILDRKARALSGGQAQRVATVRALLKEPSIVLADEPTGNLDDATAGIVLDTLFRYGRRADRTCVVVTHDQRIIERADVLIRIVQ